MTQRWRRFACQFGFGCLVAFIVGLFPVVTPAQLLTQPTSTTADVSRPNGVVQRQGNIEYADVTLDGMPLFTVAAAARDDDEQGDRPAQTADSDGAAPELPGDAPPQPASDVPSIEERVEQIETNLAIALIGIREFDRFRVVVGNLNNQSVIFVADASGAQSLQIVTVTDLDVKLAGTTESEVVLDRVNAIRSGLTRALEQRQPHYLWQQAKRSSRVLAIALVLSLVVAYLQRLLKRQWNWLNQCDRDQQLEMNEQMQEDLQGTQSMQEFAVLHPLQYLEMRLPRLSYNRKRNINLLIRRLLLWLQISIWLGSIIWTLTKFPQTREIGLWLMQLPVRLLAIVLVMGLIKKLGEVFIDYSLQLWAENESINPTGFHRQACRAPTFSVALKNLLGALCVIAGFIWALYELRVPITPVVASAGIIGFALSLSAQNLLKDIINGCLILWEDQYAVGDVISVGQELGFVEHMTLRITQLRDPDGELVTIPNGAISTVRNLSNGWSRVNFEIEVSYATDVDEAMEVMEQVIEQMRSEPQWGDRILEPAEILGVDKLAHTGILIRIWIKTRPLQQWNVSREFRRRLKRAFEQHHIPIGVPQQFLWVKNASELAILEQAMQSHKDGRQPDTQQSVAD